MENLKRVRFSRNDILILLREIVSCNPLENPTQWTNVQQNLNSITGKHFALRAIKSRANNLVLKWIKEERTNRAKSGIEEIHTEKEDLLQNIFDLMQQFRHSNTKECNKKDSSVKGQLDMDLWAASNDHDYALDREHNVISEEFVEINHDVVEENQEIIEHIDVDPPTKDSCTTTKVTPKRKILVPSQIRAKLYPLKKGALDYLSTKHEQQLEIRNRELQLEERKIALEERKIALEERKIALEEEKIALEERRLVLGEQKLSAESAERQVRWQMDQERHAVELSERKQLQQNFEFQQNLIDKLLHTK